MLKILNFLKPGTSETKLITMRQRFEKAQEEMNAVLGALEEMPVVQIDPLQRRIEITAPDQFADEALALPAPDADEVLPTTANDEAENSADHDDKLLAKAG